MKIFYKFMMAYLLIVKMHCWPTFICHYDGFILQFTIDKLVHGNLFLQPSHVDNVI